MSEQQEFARAGTNEVAGVINLQLYFFGCALRAWEEAEQLGPGLVVEPIGWRELVCGALTNAAISLSILLGQHSDPQKNRTPDPKEMASRLLPQARRELAVALLESAEHVRHFGLAKHSSVRQLSRAEAHAMLENARHAVIEFLQSKGEGTSSWMRGFSLLEIPLRS